MPGTPRPTIYKWLAINWMIPNLYIGNGWKSPNIHFFYSCLGFQVDVLKGFQVFFFFKWWIYDESHGGFLGQKTYHHPKSKARSKIYVNFPKYVRMHVIQVQWSLMNSYTKSKGFFGQVIASDNHKKRESYRQPNIASNYWNWMNDKEKYIVSIAKDSNNSKNAVIRQWSW